MTNAEYAIARTMETEGGFVDDDQDPGGATNFGISSRFLRLVGLDDDVQTMTKARAVEIYREFFWDMYNAGRIDDREIAAEYYDYTVLAGPRVSGRCLQRALRAVSYAAERPDLRVEEDGVVGPITTRAVNLSPRVPLLAALKSEQAGFARGLKSARFQRGWVRRAYE